MQILKKFFRKNFPSLFRFLAGIYYFFLKLITGKKQTQIIFNKIYKLKTWSEPETVSGSGSTIGHTENLRKELPEVIKELNIKSILDIPCGDFYWMKEINLPVEKYIGADIVQELVDKNNSLYSNNIRKFILLDLTTDNLPKCDMIFCRDCLSHLSIKLIKKSIMNIKQSKPEFIFASTYTNCKENKEMYVGGFRPINLQLKPFYFPEPFKLINDSYITGSVNLSDKNIGVWRITDLSA